MNAELKMYLEFRKHIDKLCFRGLQQLAGPGWHRIWCGEELAGFLMVIDGYVDAIYVKPEYRRKGCARRAIAFYLISGGFIKALHIVNNNESAKAFWNSLFDLKAENITEIDTLYRVIAPKQMLIDELSKHLKTPSELYWFLYNFLHRLEGMEDVEK